jgi:hypothetical protein
MTADKDVVSSPGHQNPYTQEISHGPKPLANHRPSLPAFESPTLEKPVVHISQALANVAVAPKEELDELEEARIRQRTLEKLSGIESKTQVPPQASDDPPTRSRLFSFSSRHSRRSLPHGSSFKDDSAKATGIETGSGGDQLRASDENIETKDHASNKGSAQDGKSDCALM